MEREGGGGADQKNNTLLRVQHCCKGGKKRGRKKGKDCDEKVEDISVTPSDVLKLSPRRSSSRYFSRVGNIGGTYLEEEKGRRDIVSETLDPDPNATATTYYRACHRTISSSL